MANHLEAQIESIVARTATAIADAVRAEIQSVVAASLGAQAPRTAPPTAPRAPHKATNARQARASAGRAPHPKRSYTDADIARVLGIITSKPAQRSEQLAVQAKLDKKVLGKVLDRLRATGAVNTKGERRAMTYAAA